MSPLEISLAVLAGLLAVSGFVLGRGREVARQKREREAAKDDASRILRRAREEAESTKETALLSGKEEAFRLRESWEREEDRRREELQRHERRHDERSEFLDRKLDGLTDREANQETRTKELDRQEQSLKDRGLQVKKVETSVHSVEE